MTVALQMYLSRMDDMESCYDSIEFLHTYDITYSRKHLLFANCLFNFRKILSVLNDIDKIAHIISTWIHCGYSIFIFTFYFLTTLLYKMWKKELKSQLSCTGYLLIGMKCLKK